MRLGWIIFIALFLASFIGCGGNSDKQIVDSGLVDTGQAFNPKKWYGKTRLELGKVFPEISNINKSVSGGPFVLKGQMGLQEITFTFENSERDAKLMNLHVLFVEPVSITQAQKKIGVNLGNLKPTKTRKYWHYNVNKPLIHGFMIDLKPADSDSSKLSRAWISYRLN